MGRRELMFNTLDTLNIINYIYIVTRLRDALTPRLPHFPISHPGILFR